MSLHQKGQTIDCYYTVVFPHKHGSYAGTYRSGLLPQRFVLPTSWTPHSGRVNDGVLLEQVLDVLRKCVRRIDAVEPVGDMAEILLRGHAVSEHRFAVGGSAVAWYIS